jgi:outer membrane protein assembly factor BamE
MNFRLLGSLLMAGCLIVTLPACVYRMDIPQGNRIDAELIEKLEIGMTRNQVRFLLGTPAVLDPYRPDQWHYVYFYKTGNDQVIEQRRMTLFFTGDLLTSIEGALSPG